MEQLARPADRRHGLQSKQRPRTLPRLVQDSDSANVAKDRWRRTLQEGRAALCPAYTLSG
jgi:hypothetical protein